MDSSNNNVVILSDQVKHEDNVNQDDNLKSQDDTLKKQEELIQKRKEQYERYIENLKNIILRQTDYSEEEVMNKLKEHNNNAMNVIREYMGSSSTNKNNKTDKPAKSENQQIYAGMRGMLDTAARNYRIKKENEEKIELMKQQFINAQNNKNKILECDISQNNLSN
jgi:hypothetical protein